MRSAWPSPINTNRHQLDDEAFIERCRSRLEQSGALVVPGFFTAELVDQVLGDSLPRIDEAFFTVDQTHNVYLTPVDPSLPEDHAFNRQITSTKGCLAHDQVPETSPLQTVYNSEAFRTFLCRVLDINSIHPYADNVSGINVHFHLDGQELGWHFDNSSFAVTTLMQAPDSGGRFEYVSNVRAADGDGEAAMNYEGVSAVLDGRAEDVGLAVQELTFEPGDLVLFRGRNSMHRVTPSFGETPRVLVVFAYNTEPGIGLSESAKATFYGRSR